STQYGGEPNPLDSTGLCLLSLDGGGVRGFSTLYILKIIMDRLNDERKKTANLPPVKPYEVFDLIGGTSTGGLIAIMLGRLEMDVDECITAYSELAEAVFREKQSSFLFDVKGKAKARFDSAKLETAVRKVMQSSASEIDLFNDGMERGCRTFVCTADRDTKNIVRLRSYSLPDEPNIRATIFQAALATSAATTFFGPVTIGYRSFADGGLGSNNPVDEVEGEAANIWCSETGDLKPLVKCFISIGTGNPGNKAFKDSAILRQTVVEIAIETESTEKKFIARWAKHFDEKRYFRFNVEQGLQSIGLDEYKQKGSIEAVTEGYLTHEAQRFRVRDCIQNMRLKQNKTKTSFSTLMDEYTVRSIRQQSAARRTLWIVPFERNPHFTGRGSHLDQLEEKVFTKDSTTRIAITGLGGVGKTQLVLELVHRTRKKYQNCSVIWIPAINMESLQQAYLVVAQQIGIPGWEEDKADVKRLVQEYLSKESAGQWLLVFDNADDIDMWIDRPRSERESRRLIDYLPRSKQGCIVFTTRNKKTAVKLAHQNIVQVLEMDEDVAVQLLQKCLINPSLVNSGSDTKALLKELTYLPLAIVQAAAYINESGITFADYLLLLADQEEEVIDLLSEEFEDNGRYYSVKNPVAMTWLISFEQIRHRDPLAANYLSFMCCINPKDIPQSLLPAGPSQKNETDALGTLDAYSFVIRRSADSALDIHRLVHLATRNWLRNKELITQWTEMAIA
ncbi:kinase subdomain-containing protein, partial [Hyaloscypha sp. PMI_1271]